MGGVANSVSSASAFASDANKPMNLNLDYGNDHSTSTSSDDFYAEDGTGEGDEFLASLDDSLSLSAAARKH